MLFEFLRPPTMPRLMSVWKSVILLVLVAWAVTPAQAQKVTDSLTDTRPGAEQNRTTSVRPQTSQTRNLTTLRTSETPQGSRLSLISDGTLNDYSAYRMGDRFFIIIPRAKAPLKQPKGSGGQGFAGLRIQPRGNDLLLSFRVPEGRSARVNQRFNKLDILLESSGASPANGNSNSAADTRNKNANKNEAVGEEAANLSSPEKGTEAAAPTPPVESTNGAGEQTPAVNEVAQLPQSPASAPVTPSNPLPADTPVGVAGAMARNWFPILLMTVILLAAVGLLWFGHARQQPETAAQSAPANAHRGMPLPTELEARPVTTHAPLAELGSAQAEEADEEEAARPALEENTASENVQDDTGAEIDERAPVEVIDAPPSEAVEPEEAYALFEQSSSPEETELQTDKPLEQETVAVPVSGELESEALSDVSDSFDDPAEEVRNRAARALYELHADRVGAFTSAIREADPERRRRIGAAMAASGLAAECIDKLSGSSPESAIEAFSLLFLMLKAGEIEPLFLAIAKHRETEVRLAVIRLLALSEDAELLPGLRRLSARGALPVSVRSALMQTIYQINMQNGG